MKSNKNKYPCNCGDGGCWKCWPRNFTQTSLKMFQREEDCKIFNASHPVGSEVQYWTGIKDGPGKTGVINYAARIVCANPMVYIAGAGAVALTHVEDVRPVDKAQ